MYDGKQQHKSVQCLTQNDVGDRDTHIFKVHFEVAAVDCI